MAFSISRALTLVLLAAASLLIVPSTSAQYFGRNKVQYDRFRFDILPTQQFDLYFYEEAETAADDAARMADRWHARHSTVFSHELTARRPLIFYANDADFQQTNVIGGPIGQGTGGVTESFKQRVVMPFTGLYAETDHVLGHELVHSFQYDLALSADSSIRLDRLPLWLIEGMAEYLSIGSTDPHTAMWLRDALAREDLPTIEKLSSGRYFPYRFGQAYMAYVGGTYGDGAVTSLYKTAGQTGLEEGIQTVTGMSPDSLSASWIRAVKATYGPLIEGRTPASEAGRRVLARESGAGDVNVGPALSPDGRYVAFLSSKNIFSMGLYVADAQTGKIVKRLRSVNRDAHFDAIRFINSSGTWSPDGRRFAFVTYTKGDNELAIWNVETGRIERRISVRGVSALAQPAWSPDGSQIALSGMDGGISDLYLIGVESGTVRQLTNDRFGDLQPAWSPDGSQLAFVTDRGPGGTNFSTLRYGEPRLALIDVSTGEIEPLRPYEEGLQHNPQFTPNGEGLYLISDHDGFSDVHYLDLTSGRTTPITHLQTGASGFTALSPAMTVASQNGRMMFSVFSDNEYSIASLSSEELARRRQAAVAETSEAGTQPGPPPSPRAGILPPWTGSGVVDQALANPTAGLPEGPAGPRRSYRPRLGVDYVAPPTLGVSIGGGFGTQLGGSVGMYLSDMLGEHNLSVELLASGELQDLGGQLTYVNRTRRLNYGLQLAHVPYLEQAAFSSEATDPATGETVRRVREIKRRTFADQVGLLGAYPLRTTRRFELQTALTRYGFDSSARDVYLYPNGTRQSTLSIPTPDPVYFSQTSAAYVVDFSDFGLTSPVQGGRYRLQVGTTLGGEAQYATMLADARRYLRAGPVTIAGRLFHIGNYGADEGDVFSSEYLGDSFTPSYVRGYSFNSFDPEECFGGAGSCAVLDRLAGTRVALTSLEVRLPLFGPRQFGLVNFPYLPTELVAFTDAGIAWSAESPPVWKWARDTDERVPVVSAGVSARINVLGSAIVEVFYTVPFQRPDNGGFVGASLLPGW